MTLEEIPIEWHNKVKKHIEILVQLGAKKIWLVGSRANGTYREDSDFDYYTEPLIRVYSKEMDAVAGYRNKKIRIL